MRLAKRKLLWETAEVGKSPLHLYRLTTEDMRFAQGIVSDVDLARVALGEVES